jgi:hypothetical protein
VLDEGADLSFEISRMRLGLMPGLDFALGPG